MATSSSGGADYRRVDRVKVKQIHQRVYSGVSFRRGILLLPTPSLICMDGGSHGQPFHRRPWFRCFCPSTVVRGFAASALPPLSLICNTTLLLSLLFLCRYGRRLPRC